MSPIKDTSEIRRLTRLGKIRLGIKKESPKTGNFYPEATDYFVVPDEVKAIYGEKPTELKIVFPIEDAPQQWYKRYSLTRGLICRGDGEKAVAQVDLNTGEIATRESEHTTLKEIICAGKNCRALEAKQCRPVMTLQFLMPDVPGALGVYQIDTSSWNSIVNVNSTLELLKACGRVSMIPLLLKLIPQQAQPDGKRKTIHVLQLVSPYTFTELLKLVDRSPKDIFLLPAAEEPPDDLFPPEIIEEPPDDLYPAVVLDAATVKPAATGTMTRPAGTMVSVQPSTDVPGAQNPTPAGKQTRTRTKATAEPPATPLVDPELITGWQQLRVLQKETAVSDAMMRSGFRKAFPNIVIPRSTLTESPPPWVTKPMIENVSERLKKYKQGQEEVKAFASRTTKSPTVETTAVTPQPQTQPATAAELQSDPIQRGAQAWLDKQSHSTTPEIKPQVIDQTPDDVIDI